MWNDIISFWNTQVNPILTTLLATVLPIVTPYVVSRISTKFTDLKALIATSINTAVNNFSTKFIGLESEVRVLTKRFEEIDVQFNRKLLPIVESQNTIISILLAIANNSRIPAEVKDNIKVMYSKTESVIKANENLLAERDSVVAQLKQQNEEQALIIADLKEQFEKVQKESKVLVSKIKNTKKPTTNSQTW